MLGLEDRIGLRFAIAAGLIGIYVVLVEPHSLFYFPRQRPTLWAAVMVLYPLLGGVLFAKTYEETGSLIISGIEHALYGGFIFTIGLGKHFYYGAVI
ncbi:MAG: hypothetical protein QNJ58_20170 [Desulfobacterales bacterium]|nr:hypothetical protein [Desulfobacterales bacterium]